MTPRSGRRRKPARSKEDGARQLRQSAKRSPARSRRPRTSSVRVWIRVVVGLALTTLLGLGLLLLWSLRPASAPDGAPGAFVVADESRTDVIDRLAAEGYLAQPQLMKAYVLLLAPGLEFPARPHLLPRGMSPRELLQLLGQVNRRTLSVTIPEGFSRFSMAQRLEAAGVCSAGSFVQVTQAAELAAALGVPAPSLEGYLFPSTYEFHQDEHPRRVALRMATEGRAHLRGEVERAGGLPQELRELGMRSHEVLILASIVEKETARASERGRIARVFLNRLADPRGVTLGRLQSDPTAGYGCLALGERAPASCVGYAGKPSPQLLRDPANPYNTYRHAGLPPGPICSPGVDAVRAVLAAPPSAELFFVADGNGNHVFSETYVDHQRAVQALRTRQR